MTEMTELRELFLHELCDILYAERVLVKTLPKLEKEASDSELAGAFKSHQAETEQHVSNIEQAFEVLDEKAKAEKCPAIDGIKQEHDDFVKDESPSPEILNSFLTGAGSRAEHYEIAAYEGLITTAEALGEEKVAGPVESEPRRREGGANDAEDDQQAPGSRLGQGSSRSLDPLWDGLCRCGGHPSAAYPQKMSGRRGSHLDHGFDAT